MDDFILSEKPHEVYADIPIVQIKTERHRQLATWLKKKSQSLI